MTRLSCPSMHLRLGTLLRKMHRRLWIAFGVAIALHSLLSQIDGLRSQGAAVRPLTTRFVKRAPRLTKPLEMKKEPKRRHKQIQRPMLSVAPKEISTSRFGDFGGAELGPDIVPKIIASAREPHRRTDIALEMTDIGKWDAGHYEAMAVRSAREPEQKIDTRLEMLDIETLDTGRYKAVVVVNPSDKRDIRGFVYLAFVHPAMAHGNGGWLPYYLYQPAIGLNQLAQFMSTHTDIDAHYQGRLVFSAPELQKLPWIFITAHYTDYYQLTRSESEILGRYFLTGGFVFGDCGVITGSGIYDRDYLALVKVVTEALATQDLREGKDWQIERLASTHPMLHSYYDFDRPPPGYEVYLRPKPGSKDWEQKRVISQPCRFIHYEGRTLGIISTREYTSVWRRRWEWDITRDLQFGVNTIIFALTQEGSITEQVMDMVEGY